MLAHSRPEFIPPSDEIFFNAENNKTARNIVHWKKDTTASWYILCIIISHTQLEDSVSTQLSQPFVHIFPHRVEVLICLIAQAENLWKSIKMSTMPCTGYSQRVHGEWSLMFQIRCLQQIWVQWGPQFLPAASRRTPEHYLWGHLLHRLPCRKWPMNSLSLWASLDHPVEIWWKHKMVLQTWWGCHNITHHAVFLRVCHHALHSVSWRILCQSACKFFSCPSLRSIENDDITTLARTRQTNALLLEGQNSATVSQEGNERSMSDHFLHFADETWVIALTSVHVGPEEHVMRMLLL